MSPIIPAKPSNSLIRDKDSMESGNRQEFSNRITSKAMILAAGLGIRLRPLTNHTPKCMVEIGGRPLLAHTIEWLQRYGVVDIIINLHHLPEVVIDYFGDGARWGVKITYSLEQQALGTAGGIKKVAWFFDRPFFLWYGDNLSNCRLDRLWEFHQAKRGLAAIALHYREDPTQSGIIALDDQSRITRFLEKPAPEEVFNHWVNAGIIVLEPKVLEMIPANRTSDLGRDIFPALLTHGEQLYGYRMPEGENIWWIDTPEDLQRVQNTWKDGYI